MKNAKKWPAFIAALIITGILAIGLILIGFNALFNPNTVAVANAPGTSSHVSSATASSGSQSAQLQQMQSLLSQYQQRIQQYQSREQQYQQQLQQAQQQLQQVEQQSQQAVQLIQALQQAGVIQINSNGQVFLRGGFGGDNH